MCCSRFLAKKKGVNRHGALCAPAGKIIKQKDIFLIDICNTVADVCFLLKEKGYRVDIYPTTLPEPGKVFTEEFFRAARPIQPVIDLVREMESRGLSPVYLTARDPKMNQVTLQWLKENNLPKAPVVYANGSLKAKLAKNLFAQDGHKIMAVLEDSPQEICGYLDLLPEAKVFVPIWDYNAHLANMPGVHPIHLA